MNRTLLVIGLLLLLFGPGRGAAQEALPSRFPDTQLAASLEKALDRPELRVGFQGVLIQSLKDGVTLYERNADCAFLPASNQKLLTSGAALALLGSNFAYHTRLYRTGKIDRNGVLHSDLILRGDGDPLLAPEDLGELARRVAKLGIRRVTGRICYDDSRFDAVPLGAGWSWDDEADDYSAQISALNVNENVLNLEVTPGARKGSLVRVKTLPIGNYVTLINNAVTGQAHSKKTLEYKRLRGRNVMVLTGNLAADAQAAQKMTVTIEEPARFAAAIFADSLRQAGVKFEPKIARQDLRSARNAAFLAEHVSPSLPAIIMKMNKPSDNLIAECLLKTLGAVKKGGGSGEKGCEAATEWLTKIGLNAEQFHIADGSGLSRYNEVSPRNITRLLTWLYRSPVRADFIASLPIAGVDGTLKNRMRDTAAQNNCRAKTGTMAHVCSLSGYVTTHDGEALVFSLLMNNHLAPPSACRAAQDAIVALLAEYRRPESTR